MTHQSLDAILKELADLPQYAVELEHKREALCRIDGKIIGTGKADFTQDNVLYALKHENVDFLLIDCPGIEGDEEKYETMVQKAITKAHLVFYVNGTGKTPETGTVERIRRYLRTGSRVCPLVNVRGNADAYEFDEDREMPFINTKQGRDAATVLEKTADKLVEALGKDSMMTGHCVQGLLAFASLAISPETGTTSIDSRCENEGLLSQQDKFRGFFQSPQKMREFSGIDAVASVLLGKMETFREDIVESNKRKFQGLIAEALKELKRQKDEYGQFMKKTTEYSRKCGADIEAALDTFCLKTKTGYCNKLDNFFNMLKDEAEEIVEDNASFFSADNDAIGYGLKKSGDRLKILLDKELEKMSTENRVALFDAIQQAEERMNEGIKRAEFQWQVSSGKPTVSYSLGSMDIDMGLKDIGGIVLGIGSWALAGTTLGSIIPGIGNAIGAVVGAVIGAIFETVKSIFSGGKKRRIQRIVSQELDGQRDNTLATLSGHLEKIKSGLHDEIVKPELKRIAEIREKLNQPSLIIQRMERLLTDIKDQLGKMPYGVISTTECH